MIRIGNTNSAFADFVATSGPVTNVQRSGYGWEWTSSRFPGRPNEVVLRGGGWGNNPYRLRTTCRHGNPPDIGLDLVGSRCAADTAVR